MAAAAIACAIACAGACTGDGTGQPDDSLGGLVHAVDHTPKAIDVGRAVKNPAELARAAAIPHSQIGALLGAHRFRGTSTVQIREGETSLDTLTVESEIDQSANGDFRALTQNSADYGQEVIFINKNLYLKPRYEIYHRRAPTSEDEPGEILSRIGGDLGAYLALLAPGVELSDRGAAQVAGRAGRTVEIKLAPKGRKPPAESDPTRAWRTGAVVTAAAGTVTLDAETGVPLAAQISGAVTVVRDGRTLSMQLSVERRLEGIGGDIAIDAPPAEETVATPERSREVAERNELLRGIAPRAKTSPTPSNPTGAAQPNQGAAEPDQDSFENPRTAPAAPSDPASADNSGQDPGDR